MQYNCAIMKGAVVISACIYQVFQSPTVQCHTHQGEQNMSIVTFGSSGENSQPYSIVDVHMRLRKGGMKDLRVFVAPSICEALTGHPITLCQDSYAHIAGLPLADASDGSDAL